MKCLTYLVVRICCSTGPVNHYIGSPRYLIFRKLIGRNELVNAHAVDVDGEVDEKVDVRASSQIKNSTHNRYDIILGHSISSYCSFNVHWVDDDTVGIARTWHFILSTAKTV